MWQAARGRIVRSIARLALIAVVVLVVLLAGTQLLLPRLAERRIAAELRATGEVERVDVRAFPALELLARRADRVEIRLGDARATTGRVSDLIAEASGVEELDARVGVLRLGRLVLRDVRLDKRGAALLGAATLTDADLRSALPAQVGFRPVEADGDELLFEATAGLFGIRATVRARLSARDGALVIAPEGLPFGGLATLTVFRDPRIAVTGVGATEIGDGYALTARGRVVK